MNNSLGSVFCKLMLMIIFVFDVTLHAQVGRMPTSQSALVGKNFNDHTPKLDLQQAESLRGKVSLPLSDAQRAEHYSQENSAPLFDLKSGKWHRGVTFVNPISLDNLPVSSSDLVVVGIILSADAHLSADGSTVYSSFTLKPQRFLKGSQASDEQVITFDRVGGVVVYPDQKKAFIGISGIGLPEIDHTYLFFLQLTSTPGIYEIKTGYCVDGTHAMALDKDGDNLDRMSPQELISQTQQKTK